MIITGRHAVPILLLAAACSSTEPGRSLGVLTVAVAGAHVLVGRSISYGQDGTFELTSMNDPALQCSGRFRYRMPPDGRARFRCSNGETGTLKIRAEGVLIGSGRGESSLGPVELVFGYRLPVVNARLPLPAGSRLTVEDDRIVLIQDTVVRVEEAAPSQ